MVSFVLVSHSRSVANSVAELAKAISPTARILGAGGLDDGGIGTDFNRIKKAIEAMYSDDGVIVLVDTGSAIMTTSMALEAVEKPNVVLSPAPLVEGAVIGTSAAATDMTLEQILDELKDAGTLKNDLV